MNRNTGQRYSNSSIIKYKKSAFSAEMQIVSLLCCYSFLIQLFLCTTGMRQLPTPAGMRCLCDGISGHTSEASFPGGRSSSIDSELTLNTVWSNFLRRHFLKNSFKCCRKQINLLLLHTSVLSSTREIWLRKIFVLATPLCNFTW